MYFGALSHPCCPKSQLLQLALWCALKDGFFSINVPICSGDLCRISSKQPQSTNRHLTFTDFLKVTLDPT